MHVISPKISPNLNKYIEFKGVLFRIVEETVRVATSEDILRELNVRLVDNYLRTGLEGSNLEKSESFFGRQTHMQPTMW